VLVRSLCLALCLSTLTPALAAGQDRRVAAAMSNEEDRALAARAAEAPQLENFQGGAWVGVSGEAIVVFFAIAIGIGVILYLLGVPISGKL
jgi:hypothetical protein